MKLQQTYLKQHSFRFKRWSRKGYAAFFSLHRAVTIGQLSSNVAERFQVKNGTNHSSVLIAGRSQSEEADPETELSGERPCAEAISWLSQLLLLLFSLQTVKQISVAGLSRVHYIIYILKREVSVHAETFRFFISLKTEQDD